jgi:hypothetical protein
VIRSQRCGGVLRTGQGTYCTPCWPKVRAANFPKAQAKALSERRRRTAAGEPDPSTSPEANQRRRESLAITNAARMVAQAGGWTPESYDELILPRLAGFDLAAICEATGLGRSMACRIRSGGCAAGPKHWATSMPAPFSRAGPSGH